ncbi:uncharacterized protein LOC110876434 [Helianthus annuus]|uniref:uncharacterized protein LOC110876434 n=1 Tax=Helianthus annuus TaxID=4232 RepID=UPI000B8F6507|nr:uncharacterized protein LOC110876434 [Helianthus annuus]
MAGNFNFSINRFWGRTLLDYETVEAIGRSGGLLTIWDPTVFEKFGVIKNRNFLAVAGKLRITGDVVLVVNIYAQNDPIERRALWGELVQLRRSQPGMWVFLGDFNDVRRPEERCGSSRISNGRKKYTYRSDNGTNMSKLDRFLVSRDFMGKWPLASVTALSNLVSDHCPILLSTVEIDYGKIPIRLFNSWFEIPGAVEYVENLMAVFRFQGPADLALDVKLKWVKKRLKEWVYSRKSEMNSEYNAKVKRLEEIEVVAEQRLLNQVELEERAECKDLISEMDRLKSMDMRQKSRYDGLRTGTRTQSTSTG